VLTSFGAMLGISLRRSRADWPIVASAALICLLAATVLAAGSIYGSAVAVAGLHRALADAPPADATITVSGWITAAEAEAADAAVTGELEGAFGPVGGGITRFGGSDTYALPDQPSDTVRALAVLGSAEDLRSHATLQAGAWPEDVPGAATAGPIPVVVSTDVADRLHLGVGRTLTLISRIDPGAAVTASVAGIFRIDDRADAYWSGETQALDGVTISERFDTHGPLFTTPEALRRSSGARPVELTWHGVPNADALALGDVGPFRDRVAALAGRLDVASPVDFAVRSGLPGLLMTTERSLLVSRSGVLLLTIQLVVLAAYAALLSASLLVEHRRVGTAMLRSRGAGTSRIVTLALIEAVLLTVSAALVAPWLAAVLLRAFNVTGPLADIAMTIDPGVTLDAFIAASVGAATCLAALTLPALRNARSVAAVHGEISRGQTRGIAQRLGFDIALLAVAAIGLWQLRLYGAPLTRTVQGALGLDPLLIATPAIGLLAGAIVALRLVPLLAELIERATQRRRGLVGSLGARQLARRPLRYTRAALLLVLAMAMGVFAVSYTWTWSESQRDQATFQVGTDVRVQPATGPSAVPRWALDEAYAGLPGVTGQLAVTREVVPTTGSSRSGRLLGLDAAAASGVVHLRPDLADAPLADLMAPLLAARPVVDAVPLAGEPRQLRFSVALDVRRLERIEFDDTTQTFKAVEADVAESADWRGLGVSVVVRDARGGLHRFAGGTATVDPGPHQITVSLGMDTGPAAGSFAWPLELFAIELSVSLPAGYQSPQATAFVGGLATAGTDGMWQPAALDLAGGWRSTVSFFGAPHDPVRTAMHDPILTADTGATGLELIPGADEQGRGAVVTFAPAALDQVPNAIIPIVAGDRFLAATGADPGATLPLVIAGVRRTVTVSGTVRAFPTTEPADPVAIVDRQTLSLLRFEGSDAVDAPDEWWLSVVPDARTAVTEALRGAPLRSQAVSGEADVGRALASDPVALGIIGGLAIGFVAAAVFAIVGFIVSASVSARERVGEFALLRALGLSSGQLSVWLSLENAVLATVSLLAGTVLGLAMAWLVLPFITVTQGAATPYPPVSIEVPWTLVAVLVGAGILALGATVAGLAWLLPRIGLAGVLRMSED
jgi:hypothetical protein